MVRQDARLQLTFFSVDTQTPYTTNFPDTVASKTADYMLRWVGTRGKKGPWSETGSPTIGA